MNFKEWIAFKEFGSPGFTVNRSSGPARPYQINPYSFIHGIDNNPNTYFANKRRDIIKTPAHQILTQTGSALDQLWGQNANVPSMPNGGKSQSFVEPNPDDPSVVNYDKNLPGGRLMQRMFGKSTDKFNQTSFTVNIPNGVEPLPSRINKGIKTGKDQFLQVIKNNNDPNVDYANVDLSTIKLISYRMTDNNNLELTFTYRKVEEN